MGVPVWFETTTFVVLGLLLAFDLLIVVRRPKVPSTRECTLWVVFYISLALIFALLLSQMVSPAKAGEFVAGWLTEYSLSVDNLFVFVIIMSRFAVPANMQQRVLMIGIILSLALRGGFIMLGVAVIERFSWVFYIFGAFLIYTAVQLVRHSDEEDEYEDNKLIRQARKFLPMSPHYLGGRITVLGETGKRLFTPMLLVLLAIGTTDLLFALDSIPAIFGLTQDPFIVFTATIFALMGLRQLYFLLGDLLQRLIYLSIGLSVILAFIGVKLVLEALHLNEVPFINGGHHVSWAPEIPIWLSLTVIIGVLAITAAVSLVVSSRRERQEQSSNPSGS